MTARDHIDVSDYCVDRHGVIHAAPVHEGAKFPAVYYGSPYPGDVAYRCGCRPVTQLFKCAVCLRKVGWCMGSDDEIGACDDCWSRARNEWRRLWNKRMERARSYLVEIVRADGWMTVCPWDPVDELVQRRLACYERKGSRRARATPLGRAAVLFGQQETDAA